MADDTFDGFDGGDGVEFNDDDIEFIDDDHDDDEYGLADDDFEPLGFEDVAEAIGLPDELPAIRVSPDTELAAQARAAALPGKLAALADWVGEDGRTRRTPRARLAPRRASCCSCGSTRSPATGPTSRTKTRTRTTRRPTTTPPLLTSCARRRRTRGRPAPTPASSTRGARPW
jgi:hypothetical protein